MFSYDYTECPAQNILSLHTGWVTLFLSRRSKASGIPLGGLPSVGSVSLGTWAPEEHSPIHIKRYEGNLSQMFNKDFKEHLKRRHKLTEEN